MTLPTNQKYNNRINKTIKPKEKLQHLYGGNWCHSEKHCNNWGLLNNLSTNVFSYVTWTALWFLVKAFNFTPTFLAWSLLSYQSLDILLNITHVVWGYTSPPNTNIHNATKHDIWKHKPLFILEASFQELTRFGKTLAITDLGAHTCDVPPNRWICQTWPTLNARSGCSGSS